MGKAMIDLWTVFVVGIAFVFGRSTLIWGYLTYKLGWFMIIPLSMFGPKPKTWERRAEWAEKVKAWSDKHLAKKDAQDFNTVEDLFKQLEPK
jgi:hypothetical protein